MKPTRFRTATQEAHDPLTVCVFTKSNACPSHGLGLLAKPSFP